MKSHDSGRNPPPPGGRRHDADGSERACQPLNRSGTFKDRDQSGDASIIMTNLQQLLQMGQQVQARLSQLQTELGSRTVTCSSGGGMVTVTADGRGHVKSIKIDRTVVDPEDVEMLEDLVQAAVNEAQQRAQQVYEEEVRKLAGGLPLPFGLPGLP
jgi:hypothetical protein